MRTNIISWASTHNTVINGYWFESQCVSHARKFKFPWSHGTACWVSCSIVVPVYLSVEILHTIEIQIYIYITRYITKEHYLLIFVIFEITRNNKCTVYSFQEKYQLVCSSILSYIIIYHISQIYQLFQSLQQHFIFKNRIRIVFSFM